MEAVYKGELAVTPASEPPSGVIPDFTGYRGLQTTWIVIISVAMVLVMLVFSAQIVTKAISKERLQIEDCRWKSAIEIKEEALTVDRCRYPSMGMRLLLPQRY